MTTEEMMYRSVKAAPVADAVQVVSVCFWVFAILGLALLAALAWSFLRGD